MNHYDAFIRDYFYEFKTISFEKIGKLTLSEKNYTPGHIPEPGAIQFQYDKRGVTEPGLAEYIALKTGKSKTLINSDLESFVELMRQFINIGKSSEIEGIGTFKLVKSGEYAFEQFDATQKKEEYKNTRHQNALNDSQLTSKNTTNKNLLMLFALLIVLGVLAILGWGSYKLFIEKKPVNVSQTDTLNNTIPLAADTMQTKIIDTAGNSIDSTTLTNNGTPYYKFIHERTNLQQRAYERTNTLRSYGYPAFVDSVKRDTGTYYTLYLKYQVTAADTARLRDSIFRMLNKKITIKPAS